VAEQGTHKPLVGSSNLPLGTQDHHPWWSFYFFNHLYFIMQAIDNHMQIEINKLIRAKRRTIAIIIERDGSLTVRAPKRAALQDIEQFIHEKTSWILRTRQRLQSVMEIPKKKFVDGEKFLFLGNEYELKLTKPQRPALKFNDGFTLGSTSQKRAATLFTTWYKEQALLVFSARVNHYASLHGFTPQQVKVTSAKTRWGSCSSNGNLNFTWRLVMAPLEVIDYVVIHELAHLKVKDHSSKFWRLVESIDPQYKSKRKWLRLNGEKLNL
jgi:predicted metal-dependent hydrolase